ncbi:hypothetical protein [Micromonospora sp. DT62]|uniref:hypothetical protein n=1 Tax=Micromonospora sp. DT62 TaxID=3416521 RepID=UPI003CF3BAA4
MRVDELGGPLMARPNCPAWCLPTAHNQDPEMHMSAPVEVTTDADRYVLHIESAGDSTPYLTVAQFSEPVDPTDEPSFEPDNFLVLKLATAAELSSAVTALIARALGGAR